MKIFISFLFFSCTLFANEEVIFLGTPDSKVESNGKSTQRTELSGSDMQKYIVKIVKRGEKYYWASRENKELIYFQSGAFHWFVCPGSGYVKVVDRRMLLEEVNPRFLYTEHLSSFLDSVNYWGKSPTFALEK